MVTGVGEKKQPIPTWQGRAARELPRSLDIDAETGF